MRVRVKALGVLLFMASGPLLLFGCKDERAKKLPPPPNVTIVHPHQKEVTRYLEYTGTTAALESVDIRARVSGFLQKICFQPRAKVKTGELLFVIDPRQYQAQVDESKAKLDAQKASSKLAQTELQISQQLESKEAISALRLEKQAAQRDVAKADVELALADLEKAKLNLEWTQVTSPIDGRVSRNLIDVGNLVGAEQKTLLTTVVNDSSVYAYFNISELDALPLIRAHAKSPDAPLSEQKIPVYMALADETDFPHEGQVDFADTKIDSSTGTLQIRGIFPNPEGVLMPGMFVRVRVPIEKKMTWLVPEVAIQYDQGGAYVMTVSPENVVQQLRVRRGTVVEGMQVIEEGLSGKEMVIVAGLQRARAGAKVLPVTGTEQSSQPVTAGPEVKQNK
jgi:membrane fusion protein, multidrug efflux system